MINYMIEVNNLDSISLHLDTPIFWTQVFINAVNEKLLSEDDCDCEDDSDVDTIDQLYINDIESILGSKFMSFKSMVTNIKGIDTASFNRFEISLLKGKLFKWEDIINDVIYFLLCFYDINDGKAELIELEIKKDAKKGIIKSERKNFIKKFPKTHSTNIFNTRKKRSVY
jgi:hypothetical protein